MRTLSTSLVLAGLALAAGCQAPSPQPKLGSWLSQDRTGVAFGPIPKEGLNVVEHDVEPAADDFYFALAKALGDTKGVKLYQDVRQVTGLEGHTAQIDIETVEALSGEAFSEDNQEYAWASVAYRVHVADTGGATFVDGVVTGYASLSEGEWGTKFFEKGLHRMAVEQAASKLAAKMKSAGQPAPVPEATKPPEATATGAQPAGTQGTEGTQPAAATTTAQPAHGGKSKLPGPD